MRYSLFATALCLSLIDSSDARAYEKQPQQLEVRNANAESRPQNALARWYSLFKKAVEPRQAETCVEDSYYEFVNNTNGQTFCNDFLNYPNTTVTQDYTPISTFTDIESTEIFTVTQVIRTTPATTVTQTATVAKRNAEVTARAELDQSEVGNVFNMFREYRRQVADSSNGTSASNTSDASMSVSFSSACSCAYPTGGSTVTETYTDETYVETVAAFQITTTTTTTTRVAGEITYTNVVYTSSSSTSYIIITDVPEPSSLYTTSSVPYATDVPEPSSLYTASTASSTSAAAPTPTSPSFTCPADNGTTVSQMEDSYRFDYDVLCDYDLSDPIFYGALFYQTETECVGACSTANMNFTSPVCQGVSYYNSPNQDGYNCFLRTQATDPVPATGVDSYVLRDVVQGIDAADPSGTNTESAPFVAATPTANASMMSSSMSSMMGNSTTSMPIITPGPQIPISGMMVVPGSTQYVTYVSDGSTYSSGTAFYTSYQTNGSWYVSYFTSYTEVWTSATTVEEQSSSETTISSSNNTETSQSSDNNGEYSIITDTNSTYYGPGNNVTIVETITHSTYNDTTNSLITSSATTYYYSYETGSAGSGSGGSGNGSGSGGNITSTSYYTSETVIINSGATGGASGYQSGGSVTTNSNGLAFSSGYGASGAISGTGGASGYATSGAIPTPTPSVNSTILINSAGTAYSSGYGASGAITGTGGSSGTAASGAIPTTSTVSYSFTNSLGSRTDIPSYPTESTISYSFTNSLGSRTDIPSYPTGTPLIPTGTPSNTSGILTFITPTPYIPPSYTPVSPVNTSSIPGSSSSPSYSFTNSLGSRSGTLLSTSTGIIPTAPSPYGPPTNASSSVVTGPPSYITPTPPSYPSSSSPSYSFTNSLGSRTDVPPYSTGTAPISTGPASSGSPVPSSNITTPLGPTSPSFSFTNSLGSRTDVPPYSTATAPSYTIPTAPPTCTNGTMGTTTIFVTTTEFGCYSTCAPAGYGGWGGYGGPGAWGPPVVASSTAAST